MLMTARRKKKVKAMPLPSRQGLRFDGIQKRPVRTLSVPMKPKKNLVSDDMWEQGILSATGAEQNLDTGIRTKFIPVKPGRTYTGKYHNRFDYFLDMLYWYDENKSFIGRNTTSANPKTITLPSNAFYVRAFYRANSTITPDLASNLKYQLEEGSVATDWEPYELIPDLKPAR